MADTTDAGIEDAGIENALRELGSHFDPQVLAATRALYRPLASQLPWADREGRYDLAYGPHERHRLDVYPSDLADSPVMLFIHGGGFAGGCKRGDDCFYGNVGRYFAAHGYCSVLANYRLAPAFGWPSGNEDMAAILAWVVANVAEHGGDPSRIFLVGQSAGAAHSAGYLFHPRVDRRHGGAIKAVALLSGFYCAKEPMLAGPRQYIGDDSSLWADRSVVTHVSRTHPPLFLSVAELDPASIAGQTLDLAQALNNADGSPPQIMWFGGHNHVSTVHGLGVGRDEVGRALRSFAARNLGS